jgi:hypothetical protein
MGAAGFKSFPFPILKESRNACIMGIKLMRRINSAAGVKKIQPVKLCFLSKDILLDGLLKITPSFSH